MRDLWPMSNVKKDSKRGLAKYPKRLKESGIREILLQGLNEQGIRETLPKGVRRHRFKVGHGMRKFFETVAIAAGMLPLHVAVLMSHDIGISQSYFRPEKDAVLRDYLKVVPNLTINNNNTNVK